MTLDEAECNLGECFDYGQGYVALSRVKSIEGLRVVGLLRDLVFQLNPLALKADKRFKQLSLALDMKYDPEMALTSIIMNTDISKIDKEAYLKVREKIKLDKENPPPVHKVTRRGKPRKKYK